MEAHINFKICVENSIAELEKDLPVPVKARGRPKKDDSEKKQSLANGHGTKASKGRGR